MVTIDYQKFAKLAWEIRQGAELKKRWMEALELAVKKNNVDLQNYIKLKIAEIDVKEKANEKLINTVYPYIDAGVTKVYNNMVVSNNEQDKDLDNIEKALGKKNYTPIIAVTSTIAIVGGLIFAVTRR